jgi:hypothetical protein
MCARGTALWLQRIVDFRARAIEQLGAVVSSEFVTLHSLGQGTCRLIDLPERSVTLSKMSTSSARTSVSHEVGRQSWCYGAALS